MTEQEKLAFAKKQLGRLKEYQQEATDILSGELNFEFLKDGDCWEGAFYVSKEIVREMLDKEVDKYTKIVNELSATRNEEQ